MGKMRQKDYPSTFDIRHVSSSLVLLSVLRRSWWRNHNFFHETSKKLFVFLFPPDKSIALWDFVNFKIYTVTFSFIQTEECLICWIMLCFFKACHHSLQDIRCGEGWCYSFTIHFIPFDFMKKKYTKIWKGKNKSFNNNQLQCDAVVPSHPLFFYPLSLDTVINQKLAS